MDLRLSIIFLLFISTKPVFGQLVSLKGTVSDENKVKLSGVTVKVGNEITRTNDDGYFELAASLKTLVEKGINFSCVGYLRSNLLYQSNHFYEVQLTENTTQLNEIIIAAGDDIIKKAIKRIPENYPDKPISIKGVLRTQMWRNQSEYFKSDALLRTYIPSYSSNEKTTVTVLQNRIDTLYDKSLKYLKHSSNYNVVEFQDLCHNNYIMAKISKKKKFDYRLVGKQIYNSYKVFVINVTLKDTAKNYNKIEATIYIDTASYAFVAANIYTYNLVRKGLLTNKILNYRIDYERIGKKWYLKETHAYTEFKLNNQVPQTTVDFIRTEIDSINAQKIPYKDIVQNKDNILLINKVGNAEEWAKYNNLFREAENNGKMKKLSATLLDTIKQNNAIANQNYRKSFSNRIFDYISKDNIRTTLGLAKFPVSINSELYPVSESVNYGISIGSNYRLYKSLFVGFQIYSNVWNKKHINLSAFALNFSNEFVFNGSSRSMVLTPYTGFERLGINYEKTKVNYNILDYGLRVSYELTHKKALFISSAFKWPMEASKLKELAIKPTRYMLGIGIVFKR